MAFRASFREEPPTPTEIATALACLATPDEAEASTYVRRLKSEVLQLQLWSDGFHRATLRPNVAAPAGLGATPSGVRRQNKRIPGLRDAGRRSRRFTLDCRRAVPSGRITIAPPTTDPPTEANDVLPATTVTAHCVPSRVWP